MAPTPPTLASRGLVLMQRMAAVLLGLSILLLAWNFFGMVRTIELTGLGEQRYGKRDDSAENGASHSTLTRAPGALALDCTLEKGYQWPYCGYFFSAGVGAEGIDLSGFDTVTIDLERTGPPPHDMRLYIRNFEPGISRIEQWETQKVNEVEFDLPEHGPIVIPLKLLRTAAWWSAAQRVPLLRRDTRIDHATDVELYTGGGTQLGKHRFVLKSMRIQGKFISQYRLLLWLVRAWIGFGMAWLLLGLMHYRANLNLSKARLVKLSSINRALELEAQELASQVYVDPLTGALNRQGLRNVLMKQLLADEGDVAEFAVMFVDIDHFKRINDGHGHSVGDAVLRHFAAMVKLEIRATDILVRWGGEEFLIVCPGTDLVDAHALGEKLRSCVTREPWPAALNVTASFGITKTHAGEHFGDAIDRADKALYRAKENGRNRIELERIAPPDAAHGCPASSAA
jgi:diguanylate cyclase (GGDEF)-like protein